MAGPGSKTMAPSPNSFMAAWALAIRARWVDSETSLVCGISRFSSPEGLIDSRALFGEHAHAVFGNVHAIFEAHTELAIDRDGGFVAEAHAGSNPRLVASNQVSPLVAVQPDAVAGAVRQAWDFVAWSEAGVGNHFACGGVH